MTVREPSAAQVRALALIATHGARHSMTRAEKVIVWLSDRDATTLRSTSAAALARNGLITLHDNSTVSLTDVGHEVLDAHPDALTQAARDKQIAAEHRPTYMLYNRGRHPIAGWGAVAKGCQVKCSCGEFDIRANDGRKSAQSSFNGHIEKIRRILSDQ